LALSEKNAAMLLPDKDVNEKLITEAISLVNDENRRKLFSVNIKKLAERDTDIRIAREVMKLIVK
jgi:UDP-N-acetylglucosamine--N-acetylmuramyl-(pentapeptide) pyrophosphoryl-undecaprenol N-acetylglucosamine transferase